MTILVYDQARTQPHSFDDEPVMFLAFGKIKSASQATAAARHNKRSGGADWRRVDCIDATRSHRNYVLHGPPTAKEVRQMVDCTLKTVRRKIREGTILLVEVVVSLPVGSLIDDRIYFSRSLAWVVTVFAPGATVVSADVHLDEGARHMHVLLVPAVGGRLCGHALIGGPGEVGSWLDSFHAEVASKHGLRRRRGNVAKQPRTDIAISCAGGSRLNAVQTLAAPVHRPRGAATDHRLGPEAADAVEVADGCWVSA